jgi:molecular chaperone DnaK
MPALGIDLGTTFSAVARVDAAGRSEVILNRDGESITPSVVLFQGDQVLVGSMAKRSAAMFPDDCVQFVKRYMGDQHWSHIDSAGVTRRAEEISALILRRLVDDAEMMTGEKFTEVVITVPAYFDDARRQATKDAAALAGLSVLRLLNEPTGAAIAYGIDHSDAGTILVYDLGGGTFDVTVLRRDGDELVAVATDGDRNLGGFDFDNVLMELVARKVADDGGPDLFDAGSVQADLREKCELAKRTLSNVAKASVYVSVGGRNFSIPISREEFAEATEPLLFRTQVCVDSVLEAAGVTWSQVDRLLLVGGSTRMPMVRELMTQLSGKQPEVGVNPDEAVAVGAGAVAVLSTRGGHLPSGSPQTFQDITSQGLGVAALDETQRLRNSVIIHRNSQVPCQRSELFYTLVDAQERVQLQVIVGDDPDLDFCAVVHERPIELPPGLPAETCVKIVMSYDIDGIVHLSLSLPGRGPGGTDLPLGEVELERPSNIDADELRRMRRSLVGLKVE